MFGKLRAKFDRSEIIKGEEWYNEASIETQLLESYLYNG